MHHDSVINTDLLLNPLVVHGFFPGSNAACRLKKAKIPTCLTIQPLINFTTPSGILGDAVAPTFSMVLGSPFEFFKFKNSPHF